MHKASIMPGRYIRTQSHSFYDCKYHTVFTPQYKGKYLKANTYKKKLEELQNSYANTNE